MINDEELDSYFISLLKNVLIEMEDSYEYTKKYTTAVFKPIIKDYELKISELKKVISTINTVDDFADFSDKIIDHIYEEIYDYSSNYIIHPETKEKDLEEYSNIEEILFMFVDEDYDEE